MTMKQARKERNHWCRQMMLSRSLRQWIRWTAQQHGTPFTGKAARIASGVR